MDLKTTPSLSNFLAALACVLELFGVLPAFSGSLMQIQFIVIHSSAFILFIPFMNVPEGAKKWIFRGLLGLYTALAVKAGGLLGVLQFAGLTYASYSGYILKKDGEAGRVSLILRWACSFAAFIISLALTGAPSNADHWPEDRRLALTASIYFCLTGFLEMSGIYEKGWKKALRRAAEKDGSFRVNMPGWLNKELFSGEEGKAGPDKETK